MIVHPVLSALSGVLLSITAQAIVLNVAKGVAIIFALLVLRAIIGAMGTGIVCVLVNTGSEEEAVRIGQTLVEERLAGAANVTQPIRSFYRWQGKVEDRPEALLILKTTSARLKVLIHRVAELHSYQVPSILALYVVRGHKPYLNWILEATDSQSWWQRIWRPARTPQGV